MKNHKHIKVLLVDDTISMNKYIRMLLEKMGDYFLLSYVSTAESLFDHLDTSEPLPNLILLDINLPGMKGLEACKAITELYPSISVLIITAELNTVELKGRTQRAGAKGFLTKPFTGDQLLETINDIICIDVTPEEVEEQRQRRIEQYKNKRLSVKTLFKRGRT